MPNAAELAEMGLLVRLDRTHASSHIIGDDFVPLNTEERLMLALIVELRALNTSLAGGKPAGTPAPAAPRRDDAPAPSRATAAPPRIPQGPPPKRPPHTGPGTR